MIKSQDGQLLYKLSILGFFYEILTTYSRMPWHSCCEVRVMQLHDIPLLRTSNILSPLYTALPSYPSS